MRGSQLAQNRSTGTNRSASASASYDNHPVSGLFDVNSLTMSSKTAAPHPNRHSIDSSLEKFLSTSQNVPSNGYGSQTMPHTRSQHPGYIDDIEDGSTTSNPNDASNEED